MSENALNKNPSPLQVVFALIVIIGFSAYFLSCMTTCGKAVNKSVAEANRKEAAKQEIVKRAIESITPEQLNKMADFCQSLKDNQCVYKYDVDHDFIQMQVMPDFMLIPIDDKRNYVGIVFRFFKATTAPDAEYVSIVDYRSGKSVGMYNPTSYGLDMK